MQLEAVSDADLPARPGYRGGKQPYRQSCRQRTLLLRRADALAAATSPATSLTNPATAAAVTASSAAGIGIPCTTLTQLVFEQVKCCRKTAMPSCKDLDIRYGGALITV